MMYSLRFGIITSRSSPKWKIARFISIVVQILETNLSTYPSNLLESRNFIFFFVTWKLQQIAVWWPAYGDNS